MRALRLRTPFESMLDTFMETPKVAHNHVIAPESRVVETENGYMIQLAIPGSKREDVEIKLENQWLIVNSKEKEDEKKSDFNAISFADKRFRKVFQLPKTIDTESIKAAQENGILTISLENRPKDPKVEKLISID